MNQLPVTSCQLPVSSYRLPASSRRFAPQFALALCLTLTMVAATVHLPAQQAAMSPEQVAQRWDREKELQSLAVVDRKVMMPMRDGVRLATDIYRPKDVSGPVPTVFVKTPYNFNY